MKVLRPSAWSIPCGIVKCAVWTAVWGAVWAGFCWIYPWIQESEYKHRKAVARQEDLRRGGLAAIGAIGGLCLLRSILWRRTARYEIGATELVARTGALWRATQTVPLAQVGQIEISSGPLIRLFGMEDLHVGSVTLCSLRNAEELRAHLLERRDALRESALAGDHTLATTSHEIALERLARAVDRLEQRFPATPAG